MIVVSNSFIPSLKKRKGEEDAKNLLATTNSGDLAHYKPIRRRAAEEEDEDEDDERTTLLKMMMGIPRKRSRESDSREDTDYRAPQQSLTGSEWLPNFSDRMTVFIAGIPGAGKTYLAKELIKLLPPTLDILLFTALEENDGNFDELGKSRIYKIKMTPENLDKITLKEIRERMKGKQCILLFDDVDKIRNHSVEVKVFALMNDALANGRGHEKHDGNGDIHVICTSHAVNDYKKTKFTFENSNYVALFPASTPILQMQRMFDKLGLDKELCDKMMSLARRGEMRSIIIHKVTPMYMIFGDKIMLL